MPTVDFASYPYLPSMLCGDTERMAYERLADGTKDGILPIFELSRRQGADNSSFEGAIDMLKGTVPVRPFVLDLDRRAAPEPYQAQTPSNPAAEAARVAAEQAAMASFNAELSSLLTPDDGFANWRGVTAEFPNAVPLLQFTNPTAQAANVITQAAHFAAEGKDIAVKVRPVLAQETCSLVVQIIQSLPAGTSILVILDCGQGRRGTDQRVAFVIDSMDAILAELDASQAARVTAVCMSNSYPLLNHDGLRVTSNCDWEVWRAVREVMPVQFGDYAASNRQRSLSSFIPRTWRATVVHTLDDEWLIHRHENAGDANGWVVGSSLISQHPTFDPLPSWCDQIIAAAANGNLAGVESARFWHAAKINGHIERQLVHAAREEMEFEAPDF